MPRSEREAVCRARAFRLPDPAGDSGVSAMVTSSNPYRVFRFRAEVSEHAVWPDHWLSLSVRDVELILAARGIVINLSYG
jgi:hypothetical protein